jgi:anti-sigma regulatory factor (Ser/Thr protein kinase)
LTEIRKELPPSPVATALARQALDGWLSTLVGEQTADDIRVAATELVSNAVRHGRLGPDDKIVLFGTVDSVEGIVRIEVEQPSLASARVKPGTYLAESGLGLRIVDKVSKRWGSDEGPPGVVWFEIDR